MTRAAPKPFDPLAEVLFSDSLGIAGDLEQVLNAITPYNTDTIKAILHKKPAGPGAWALIRSYTPPINMDEISEHLKAEFGGGDYRLTIFAGGKTRKQIEFSILGEPKMPSASGPGRPADAFGGGDFFKYWMAMQAEQRQREDDARRDREAREEQWRRDQQTAADRREDRQTALVGTLVAAFGPALIPVLTGANREKLTDLLAIMNSQRDKGGGMKETLDMLMVAKTLFGDGPKPDGWDPADIVGSLGRLAGPVAEAAGRAFRGRGAQPAEVEPPEEYLSLPEPDPPAATGQALPPPPPPAGESSRLVALVRPHILFFFGSDLPPDLAAEAIVVILRRENVSDEEVAGFATAFALSPDWKTDLAGEGIDLRSNPEWADEFLDELVGQWSESAGNPDAGDGDPGRRGDPADDAPRSPPGGGAPKRKGKGAAADTRPPA